MSKENIKIDESVKERLDEVKELPRFRYAEPSYSGCIEYLLDEYDGSTVKVERRDNSGGEASSEQDEEFPDTAASDTGGIESERAEGKSAQDLVDAVRVD